MTNYTFCTSLYKEDLPLICRVFNRYVSKNHHGYLTLETKEKLYYQWMLEEYDPDEWSRARNIEKRLSISGKTHVGYIKEALKMKAGAYLS